MNRGAPLLEIKDLKTCFHTDDGAVKAIDGVSLDIHANEILGLVGESGCGKSVTALSIMRLIPAPPGEITHGEILLHGKDQSAGSINLTNLSPTGRRMRSIRGNEIAMIFQEPMTSLSPVHTIGDQISEAIILHQGLSKGDAWQRAIEFLGSVRLPNPSRQVRAYPHQLSGGMRQRAMIAMALSCRPSLLIADEPTTALDVTVQAQILRLMRDLQSETGMAILLITHDLGVIARMARRVAVMYLGKVVEMADVRRLFKTPKHPYTQALLRSLPKMGHRARLHPIEGSVPDPFSVPRGCAFAPRCPKSMDRCDKPPTLVDVDAGHQTACWLYASSDDRSRVT